MSFFEGLNMLLGLAMFLFGMNLMGDSLAAASGGRLEKILEKLTNNPIKAVAMGAAVTAVILPCCMPHFDSVPQHKKAFPKNVHPGYPKLSLHEFFPQCFPHQQY